MTKSERYCDAYTWSTANWGGDPGSAMDVNRERRWLQDHRIELDAERLAALAEADLRLLEIARAETDPSAQVDLWDVLSYIGFPAEGPVTVA